MSTAYTHFFYGPEADRTRNGVCSNCGTCCVDTLLLTPLDIRRLKEYVQQHGIEPIDHGVNQNWDPPRDDVCPFYNPYMLNGQHCMVYAVRPIICKHSICHGYADPLLYLRTSRAIMEEAKKQAPVRRNLTVFLTPRSMRYSIWPDRFPEYQHTRLIFQGF